MDRTCATTWLLCAIGLAVAGWAAVSTPRPTVTWTEHHGMSPRVRPARSNAEIDPAVTFFVTRSAPAPR